jgi:transcriptional regulator with XRE-family HTH domain
LSFHANTVSNKLYLRVRQAREHADLTQEQLAAELSLTRSAIAQWEMVDGTSPSVDNMIALALRTGMGFEFLATGRGPMFVDDPRPRVAEDGPGYSHELNEQQRRLLERFDGLSPRQRTGLLDLIGDGGKRKRR